MSERLNEEPGRVLVVDEDYDTLDVLAKTLRAHGARVSLATDGQIGLKHAVDLPAEVVLVDRDVRVFDIRTFLDVLSDNPRTADAHVFVLGGDDPSELAAFHGRAEPIVKPFHAEEVAARVMDAIRVRREPVKAPELEGDLQQVALFDLLQVFAANQRTGQVRVQSGLLRAEIWVSAGRVIDATCGLVSGEKALFRVLALGRGQFTFHPDCHPPRSRIDAATEHLLMEAVRHADERAEIERALPPASTQVHLTMRPSSLPGFPVTLVAQVVEALDEVRTIGEVLDRVPSHDLEVLRVIKALYDAELVHTYVPVQRIHLCDEEEVPLYRAAAHRLRRDGVEGPVRLGVAGGAEAMRRFARALAGIAEFDVAPEPTVAMGTGLFGPLGRLALGGTDVELFAVPLDPELRPFWGVFLAVCRVALVLEEEVEDDALVVVSVADGFDRPAGAAGALREAIGSARRLR